MRALQEYHRHAEECEALAKKALSLEHRDMIAQMAETWRLLAEQRQRKLARRASQNALLNDQVDPLPQNDD